MPFPRRQPSLVPKQPATGPIHDCLCDQIGRGPVPPIGVVDAEPEFSVRQPVDVRKGIQRHVIPPQERRLLDRYPRLRPLIGRLWWRRDSEVYANGIRGPGNIELPLPHDGRQSNPPAFEPGPIGRHGGNLILDGDQSERPPKSVLERTAARVELAAAVPDRTAPVTPNLRAPACEASAWRFIISSTA